MFYRNYKQLHVAPSVKDIEIFMKKFEQIGLETINNVYDRGNQSKLQKTL